MSTAENNKCVGIDLGTTNSEMYRMDANGNPVPCVDNQGLVITPSRVVVSDKSTKEVVFAKGAARRNVARKYPENDIYEPKRVIGRLYKDDYVKRDIHFWPFTIVEGEDGLPNYKCSGKDGELLLTAVDIDAEILRTLKAYAKEGVENAVITVPSYFSKSQIDATKKAGEQAGFTVKDIIPEPVAAAIAYAYHNNVHNHVILVYDLGGGTFDCCLVRVINGKYEVLAKDGHSHLGGADFDNAIVQFVCREYKDAYKCDLYERKSDLNALKAEAEKTKISLSDQNTNMYTFRFKPKVMANEEELPLYTHDFTRAEFEGLIQKDVQTTIGYINRIMNQVNLSIGNIDDVVCVGGSTRIPLVRSMLQDLFKNKTINFEAVNIDEAVAQGAAIYADKLMKGEKLLYGAYESIPADIPTQEMKSIGIIPYNIYYNYGMGYNKVFTKGTSYEQNEFIKRNRNLSLLFNNMKFYSVDLFYSTDDKAEKQFFGRMRLEFADPVGKESNAAIGLAFTYNKYGKLNVLLTFGETKTSTDFLLSGSSSDADELEGARVLYDCEVKAKQFFHELNKKEENEDTWEKRKDVIDFLTYLNEFGLCDDAEDIKDYFENTVGKYISK